VKSDFDTDSNRNVCVVAIPPELGVSIPANGGRRSMYFKIDIRCEDALKMEFGVSGVVKLGKSPQVEVPIREKRFTYACKYGDFIKLKESLRMSKSEQNMKQSAFYCAEICLVLARHDEIDDLMTYLTDMQNYASEGLKTEVEGLLEELKRRKGMLSEEKISEEFTGRLKNLLHQVRMGR